MKIFNKKNVLKHCSAELYFPNITSAKKSMPEWYKKTEKIVHKNDKKILNSIPIPLTMKACSVFMDSFTTGYMMPLAIDIAVEQTEGGPSITWSPNSPQIIGLRQDDHLNKNLPIPEGFSSLHFTWLLQHRIEIPAGYSVLLTHPLNRYDLPFLTLGGVVDGYMAMHGGNVPVFFSKTFEGIIPAGTPILQIIPFKREDWTSEIDRTLIEKSEINNIRSNLDAMGYYKNNFWKMKRYD